MGNKTIASTVQIAAINPKIRTLVQVKIKNNKMLKQKKKTEATKRPHTVKLIVTAPVNKASAICPTSISNNTMINANANDRNIGLPPKIYSPIAANLSA